MSILSVAWLALRDKIRAAVIETPTSETASETLKVDFENIRNPRMYEVEVP
jgi:hypothetical protein